MKKKLKKNKNVYSMLFIMGILILGVGFFTAFIINNHIFAFIGMFTGSLLMIPYSFRFYLKNRETEYSSIFWFVWFITLPLLVVICIIYFLKIWT